MAGSQRKKGKAVKDEVRKVMVWGCKGVGRRYESCKISKPFRRLLLCSEKNGEGGWGFGIFFG